MRTVGDRVVELQYDVYVSTSTKGSTSFAISVSAATSQSSGIGGSILKHASLSAYIGQM